MRRRIRVEQHVQNRATPLPAYVELHIRENATNTSDDDVAHVTGYIGALKNYGDSITAVYHHPSFIHPLTRAQALHLDVVDVSDPDVGTVLASYRIVVVQPPLMLVHGIWSTGEAAFPGLKEDLVEAGLYERESQIRYGDYPNDRSIAEIEYRFIANKNALLQAYADDNISASKIDIIAHSMGGLVSRYYIQDNRNYRGDVNKLITLNTPHSGTQMANFAVLLPPPVSTIMAATKHDPTKGAVEDLRYDSPIIRALNRNPNTKGVAVHAITTNITLSPVLPLQALINGNFNFEGFLAGWAALTYPNAAQDVNAFLTDVVYENPHDLFVGLNSQQGGLTEDSPFISHFYGQHHSSGGTPAIHEKMAELLRQDGYSTSVLNEFTRSGFQPITIDSDFPDSLLYSKALSDSEVDIISPTLNTLMLDADSILVTVATSPDITRVLLLAGAETPELTTKLIEGPGGSTYLRVPKGSLGRLHLAAFAFAGTEFVDYDTLGLELATAADIQSLHVEPRVIYVAQHDSTVITVVGDFTDGIARTISGLPDVEYSFTHKLARANADGWVVGLAPGTDTLLVTYEGKTDLIEIVVTSLDSALLPVLVSFTPPSGPIGTTVSISGSNFQDATAVSFNGTPALNFTIDSTGSLLTVMVPAKATSGTISITTPYGTATSKTHFIISDSTSTATSWPVSDVRIWVYPNPAQTLVNVVIPVHLANSRQLQASLIDSQGKIVYTKSIDPYTLASPFFIDVRDLSRGIYFLCINGGLSTINTPILLR